MAFHTRHYEPRAHNVPSRSNGLQELSVKQALGHNSHTHTQQNPYHATIKFSLLKNVFSGMRQSRSENANRLLCTAFAGRSRNGILILLENSRRRSWLSP